MTFDDRSAFRAGLRAASPVLLGVFPFGLVTGVALVLAAVAGISAGMLALHLSGALQGWFF